MNWRRHFAKPVYIRGGVRLATLGDARRWALQQPSNWQNQYQMLAGALLAAAQGGESKAKIAAARLALINAAVLNLTLDFAREVSASSSPADRAGPRPRRGRA